MHKMDGGAVMRLPVKYHSLDPLGKKAVREQYYEDQEGKCHYCKSSLDRPPPDEITSKNINWKMFPPNFLRWPQHLHHDHASGMTIGVVHAYCNAVLWQYHGE